MRADLPGVGENLSNHAIVFVGLLQNRDARQAEWLRPHPMTAFRYSSGLQGAPPLDMYINVQCKTSWSPLGFQVANLAPTLLKPMARGRISLQGAGAPPLVEFNFTGHDLDLRRFMQGFRRAVDVLAHERVRAMSSVTFPVKFNDRLRRLNRINAKNKVQSAVIARLIDLVPALAGPIFSTLADRRVDLAKLVKDDEALAEHIRENVAGTFHPVGTCRMGAADDRDAVTDITGRVRGFEGLRVIDASLMPTAPRGNTNIPTIMLAEKISAAIVSYVPATGTSDAIRAATHRFPARRTRGPRPRRARRRLEGRPNESRCAAHRRPSFETQRGARERRAAPQMRSQVAATARERLLQMRSEEWRGGWQAGRRKAVPTITAGRARRGLRQPARRHLGAAGAAAFDRGYRSLMEKPDPAGDPLAPPHAGTTAQEYMKKVARIA